MNEGERPSDELHDAVIITNVAWRPARALSFETWIRQGQRLGVIGRGVGWWIGDWLRWGNHHYGERYVRAARITGYDPGTLRNMVYVAGRFEPSRRRDNLSVGHHAEVAPFDPETQERWLDRVERDRLSVRSLREEIRRSRHLQGPSATAARSNPPEPEHVCPLCGHRLDEGSHHGGPRELAPPAGAPAHG